MIEVEYLIQGLRKEPTQNTILDGVMRVSLINQPCAGFEKFKTHEIIFEIPDGIQIVTQLADLYD